MFSDHTYEEEPAEDDASKIGTIDQNTFSETHVIDDSWDTEKEDLAPKHKTIGEGIEWFHCGVQIVEGVGAAVFSAAKKGTELVHLQQGNLLHALQVILPYLPYWGVLHGGLNVVYGTAIVLYDIFHGTKQRYISRSLLAVSGAILAIRSGKALQVGGDAGNSILYDSLAFNALIEFTVALSDLIQWLAPKWCLSEETIMPKDYQKNLADAGLNVLTKGLTLACWLCVANGYLFGWYFLAAAALVTLVVKPIVKSCCFFTSSPDSSPTTTNAKVVASPLSQRGKSAAT
jgi:hypothetical protein